MKVPDINNIRKYKKTDHLDIPTFIYALFLNGGVIYIGRTKNITNRLYTHKREKTFDEIAFFCVFSPVEANRVERELIKKYEPYYNKRVSL